MYTLCEEHFLILNAAIRGNPSISVMHTSLLYSVIIPLLKSHLVAQLAFEAFRAFRDATFEPSEDLLRMYFFRKFYLFFGSLSDMSCLYLAFFFY